MVANLANTVREWKAVKNAILRSFRIRRRGANFVISKNAPALNAMYNNYNQAHAGLNGNLRNPLEAHIFFGAHSHLRRHIHNAYKKLPNANKQLNSVAHKVMTARRMQEIRRKVLKERNKKFKRTEMLKAFLVARPLPRNMARTELLDRIHFNLHTSKTPYGPFRPRMAKYPTY